MPHPLLITGAAGNIGKELVAALDARGIRHARMSSRPGAEADPAVIYGDFRRPETLASAFAGVETLFLLSPLVPDLLEMTRNAVAAAKVAGVRHIVRSSGAGADPDSPYSIARLQGEADRSVQESGLAWTIVRPTIFMQNHLIYSAEGIRNGAHAAARGDGAEAMVDTRDIADAIAAILADPARHAGRIYTLTGGEALTGAQQMAAIGAAVGREVRYIDVPESAAVEAMTAMGIPPAVVDWLASLNAVVKAGHAAGTTGDVQALTGHAPRRFADFVRENAGAWR